MKTEKPKTVTIKDIAEMAGVSKNTVSLALRDSPRISVTRKRQIQQLAKKLKYVPNYAARNLITNRSGMIGVYLQALKDDVRINMVNSLLAELNTAEYKPILGLGYGHNGPWHRSPWMKTFQQLNIEALVLIGHYIEKLPAWIKKIPTIILLCEPNEKLKCDYIALDRTEAGKLAVEHALSVGRRHILLASDSGGNFLLGCCRSAKNAQQSTQTVQIPPHLVETPSKLLEYVKPKIIKAQTAIIFGDSGRAADFNAVAISKNIKIPEDLAVISYDYLPHANQLAVPITTIEQPIAKLASTAQQVITRRLHNPNAENLHIVLNHQLVRRKST